MKTCIKIIAAFSVLFSGIINAQEHTIEVKNANKVEITSLTGEIKIVGHDGSNIIVEAGDLPATPERAKGLKPISGSGIDNTGIGLSITEAGNVINISGATKKSADADYTFKIPNTLAVMVDYSSPFTSGDLLVEDFGGEFEMKSLNDGVNLTNVTGPVFLDLINGDIEIAFKSVSQKSPMSVKTINGDIDISMPASAKANLNLYTLHGDIYSDLDIEVNKTSDDKGMRFMGGSSDIKSSMNGGGIDFSVSTINGNLYLRKK
jgi:hypothetical protein